MITDNWPLLEKAFWGSESPITRGGQQLWEGEMAVSDIFKPQWRWRFQFKRHNKQKTNKCHVHHNCELSGVLVMLPQLSCLLYGFHVKEVSPKYCLLSTTCYKMSPHDTLQFMSLSTFYNIQELCHSFQYCRIHGIHVLKYYTPEVMSSNFTILWLHVPKFYDTLELMSPNFTIL